jgi:serine/threonine protein kinase
MLIATQGPLAQQRFTIPSQGLTIGRHPDNDIVLADELMVSRYHAVITVEDGQYVLYDRDSANGTWVNEERTYRRALEPGDRIGIWHSRFAFSTSDTPPPAPKPSIAPQPTIHVVGEHFCGYHLESLIGRGGMSEVYRARDSHGRAVAIKILCQTDPYLVTKFVQEGNQIGPLLRGHDNIVYVHEFGQSPDSRLFIVMEYVDAPSLRKSLKGPLGEADTVKIVGQVCSALSFAHQNEIVHRDIKPENLLLTADGVVKVLDFGIAKLTSASTVTRDKIVGTPEYISPEQARGDPVRPASDVYSLGIVLYEMLTGTVPFRRPSSQEPLRSAIEVIRQHLEEEAEPLRKRNPSAQISPQLERVTMRALSKSLQDRYTTAEEMGQAMGCHEPPDRKTEPPIRIPAYLAIVRGPRRGQRIPLSDQAVILGRLELDAANTMISRRHASVSFRGGSYWLEDSSKNGTWVDNVRVYGEVPLADGSVIMIGDNVLRLESTPP